MSDQTSTTPDEDGDLTVSIHLWPEDSSEAGLRQIGLGITPFLMIEPQADGDDVTIVFTGSLVDSHEELLEMLEEFTEVLRATLQQVAEDAAEAEAHGDEVEREETESRG